MKIKELILETSRLDLLGKFYGITLDLPVEKLNNSIQIRIGSTELVFRQSIASDPFYHFAINIPANKIEEAKEWIKGHADLIWIDQYESDIADFVNWHAKSIYFYDPAGNILELIARFDLHNEDSAAFSSSQLLSISEVGMVFSEDELEKRTEDIIREYHVRYFEKQPPLPQFKALGNDEGLFIIVPEKRYWFPTSTPSGIFPLEVTFVNKDQEFQLECGRQQKAV